MNKLAEIQQGLKAPKNQENKFGHYNYRSCEDILEAVKPLLGESVLLITDDIVLIGERYYVKATVQFITSDGMKSVSAFARETFDKKGMDAAQITGAASSYARKYALNGLFCIDDTKEPDNPVPQSGKKEKKPATKKTPTQTKEDKQMAMITQAFFDYTTEHTNDLAEGFEWDETAFTRIIKEGEPKTVKDFKNIVKNLPSKLVIREKK